MAWPSIALLLATALASAEALRLGKPAPSTGLSSSTSQRFPEDLLAHPAFKVHFDDRATVSNSTASALLAKSRAAQHGGSEELDDWSPRAQHHVLIHSTPRQAHLCSLTPSTASTSSSPSSVSIESSLTPSNVVAARHRVITSGLSLLAPLKGTCLYHTLDWFTYSLCFGEAVRQFKAIEATVGAGRIPAQDPSKDAYVLGRWRKDLEVVGGRLWNESDARALPNNDGASTSSSSDAGDDDDNGTDLMQTIRFTTLGTEQRYLSQLWTDGTRCDINDEPRSVEVQYHCNPTLSGAGASRIALIKETTTCSYVMVVETGLTCREKELRVGREGRGREEGVGEWRCVRVVEGEEVKEGLKGLEGEAKPRDEEEKKVQEEEDATPAPARDESDYLHTKSTSPWLPSTENPTAISSDTFYAVSWDEDGHLVVDSIGSFAADWLQVEEEEQLLREQQEGGGDVDPEDAAQRHLQARAAAGQKLRELVAGGGEGDGGEAAAAAPERPLEEILSEVLFSGQAGNDGERGDGNGVRVHILDGAEDGEPLAGIAGLRRRRRHRGEGEEDEEPVEVDADDLQASLARAIEEELNRLRAKGRGKEQQQQQQQQSNTAPPETTQGTKDAAAESQQRKARLDRLAAALVESMQDGGEQAEAAGEGQRGEEAAAAQGGGNARVFDELNGAARAQAWTPKPFAPGQEGGAVRRETLAEKAERVYRDRDRERDDGEEREQEEGAAARGGAGGRHDEL